MFELFQHIDFDQYFLFRFNKENLKKKGKLRFLFTFKCFWKYRMFNNPFTNNITGNRCFWYTLNIWCTTFNYFCKLNKKINFFLFDQFYFTSFKEFIFALKFGRATILSNKLRCNSSTCSRRLDQATEHILRKVESNSNMEFVD